MPFLNAWARPTPILPAVPLTASPNRRWSVETALQSPSPLPTPLPWHSPPNRPARRLSAVCLSLARSRSRSCSRARKGAKIRGVLVYPSKQVKPVNIYLRWSLVFGQNHSTLHWDTFCVSLSSKSKVSWVWMPASIVWQSPCLRLASLWDWGAEYVALSAITLTLSLGSHCIRSRQCEDWYFIEWKMFPCRVQGNENIFLCDGEFY